MKRPDDVWAFPRPAIWSPDGRQVVTSQTGMTLRDYFAGQALPNLVGQRMYQPNGDYTIPQSVNRRRAEMAYEIADAMLAERSKS